MTLTIERSTTRPPEHHSRRRWGALAALVAMSLISVSVALTSQAQESRDAAQPSLIDVGFSQSMAAHHNQAIAMTNAIRDRVHGEVAVIADGIGTKQLFEIGQFEGWLKLWEEPVAAADPMRWMSTNHQGHPMPGAISSADLADLQRAEGAQLRRLFLELMLRHHRGGIAMASQAAQHATLAPVRELAARIVVDQTLEAQRLAQLLAA